MNLHRDRISRQLIEDHPRMAWIYVSTKVDTHHKADTRQQQQCHPDRLRISVEGGVGPVAGVSAA
ncbi:hypothetical protein DBR20_11795 [Stenotrophomonas sp. HMWF023]|nr:hypothetical protein DBR20_11795 [Stenotrophomonas sp. HMWF023]